MVALYVQVIVLLAVAFLAGALIASIIRRSLYKPAVQGSSGERRVDPLPEYVNRPALRQATASPPQPVAAAIPTPAPAPPVSVPVMIQDLKRIRQIDQVTEAALAKLGVVRYEHIAKWMQPDIARIAQALGLGERISQENWIEQAQILAKGGETAYARRRARGEIATAAPGSNGTVGIAPTVIPALSLRPQPSTAGASAVVAEIIQPPLPNRAPAPTPAAVPPAAAPAQPIVPASPNVAERAAFAAESPRIAVPVRPAAQAKHDDLQRIGHIDGALAKTLEAAGIQRYAQIAQWSPQDVERFDQQLATSGRISKENWIEQAQILSRGGDTAYSRQYDRTHGTSQPVHPAKLADAIRENRKTDIGALRSVKSSAFQTEASEPARARSRPGAPDDLKRIRGIGVLIEKKLNSMGINSYDTIANWAAGDIDRVSQTLDFKGRIERENWVEQARILASGGATEFSRRVDRGEVETSRPRL